MQRAIRWAVCLVIAATSTPVFAAGDDGAQVPPADDQGARTDARPTDDPGSGGREPSPWTAPAPAPAPEADGDDPAARVAHDEFVTHVWSSP
jgi:hypothetical protein